MELIMKFTRRNFLKNSALSSAALGAGGLGSLLGATASAMDLSSLNGKKFTAVSWGGAYQDAQRNAWFTPFEEAAGVELSEDTDPSNARIISMVKAGNVNWDVCDVGLEQAFSVGEQGYLEPLDYDVIDTTGFPEGFVTKYGIGNITWSTVLAYREDVITREKPSSVADIWDTERFPGKRTLRDYPLDNLPWALMAVGLKKEEIYPLTEEKLAMAFAKMDEIKDEVVWWTGGAQPAQLLSTNEVSLAQVWNGRIGNLIDEGIPVAIQWEGAQMQVDAWAIPKNAPNKEVAMAFIAWASQAENNARIAAEIAYGPVNKNSIPMASDKYASLLPTTHFDKQLICDFNYWGPNFTDVLERWQEWRMT
ncbi:MAG: polyamine ABC transporter substrate-binding protein [Roseovarius sp.]|jgi:putative spermidine/putrescine transport system substrate-binding protein|nr:polyamine ABC transporter substrate-binding protein [Roseovarius sp.]